MCAVEINRSRYNTWRLVTTPVFVTNERNWTEWNWSLHSKWVYCNIAHLSSSLYADVKNLCGYGEKLQLHSSTKYVGCYYIHNFVKAFGTLPCFPSCGNAKIQSNAYTQKRWKCREHICKFLIYCTAIHSIQVISCSASFALGSDQHHIWRRRGQNSRTSRCGY